MTHKGKTSKRLQFTRVAQNVSKESNLNGKTHKMQNYLCLSCLNGVLFKNYPVYFI